MTRCSPWRGVDVGKEGIRPRAVSNNGARDRNNRKSSAHRIRQGSQVLRVGQKEG